jgi:peptidoglycan/xylan/chitin deacetylase (PgdA/CDA1 family)
LVAFLCICSLLVARDVCTQALCDAVPVACVDATESEVEASLDELDWHVAAGPGTRTLSHTAWHPVCLAASDHGPYFSLKDLYKRPLPKPERLLSAMIPPAPPVREYPAALAALVPGEIRGGFGQDVAIAGAFGELERYRRLAIAPRVYSTETIAYLAAHEIHHGDRQRPAVALTFDCEVGVQSTLQILETLRQENVQATFFVLGKYAYMYPDIIREIAAGGHEFGNHSFFHPLFTAVTPLTIVQEIVYTEAAIDWAVGYHVPMRYIRFPYGGRNDAIRQHAAALGYQSAFWNLDPRGWEPDTTAQDVVGYIARAAYNGGIVIMHCGCWDDARALPDLIRALQAKGLHPGTLSDVLADPDRNIWR